MTSYKGIIGAAILSATVGFAATPVQAKPVDLSKSKDQIEWMNRLVKVKSTLHVVGL